MSTATPKALATRGPEERPVAVAPGQLISDWLPALPGVVPRLERGAKAADVGCRLGAAIVLLARTFPHSRFVGFDAHLASIELARQSARQAKVADRALFEVAHAADFPGSGYQLITHLDGLREVGDPVAAARHVRRALAPAGTWLLVEPLVPSEARLRQLLSQGGFSRFRRVAQTSSHSVFEARA